MAKDQQREARFSFLRTADLREFWQDSDTREGCTTRERAKLGEGPTSMDETEERSQHRRASESTAELAIHTKMFGKIWSVEHDSMIKMRNSDLKNTQNTVERMVNIRCA